jgi:AcrR family transcriptional regulator
MTTSAEERAKPPGRYHHGSLRAAMLDSTLELVDEGGLHSVSLRAVARRLGVSDAALYHHFPTKEALVAALAANAYRALHAVVEDAAASAGPDPFDRLDAAMRAYVRFGLGNRGRYRVLFGEHALALTGYAETSAAGRAAYTFFSDCVAGCAIRAGRDPVDTTRTGWALLHGIVTLVLEREIRFEDDGHTAESLLDTAVGMFVEDLRGSGRGP